MSSKTVTEFLTAIGVIASLVFVGLELRQNNALARAEAFREMSDTYMTYAVALAADEQLAEVMAEVMDGRRAAADLTEMEFLQVGASLTAWLKFHESVYLQVREGVLDTTAYRLLDSPVSPNAFVTDNWRGFRAYLSDDFASFYEDRYGLSN
jgi:hypothetical protein